LEILSNLGCDVGQGFYFARPQPPEQVVQILAADKGPAVDADLLGPAGAHA
ncbi:MAG: hypothetical protein QOD53_2382, partial [Thermoleophilaceae bacterium]|nr:hypothetical protein [Thermoleophilaceae bacterium]